MHLRPVLDSKSVIERVFRRGCGTIVILPKGADEKPKVYVLYRRCVKCRISPQLIGLAARHDDKVMTDYQG